MRANEIVNILNHFKDSSYQKILINGNWGIGKTKYVIDFIKSHSNACSVSLFGKRDVNSIIQEIYYHIIENAPVKKYFSSLREKMENLNISFSGLSLSIPVIEDLQKELNKELNQKDKYIIVLDDLERKHHELDIKEIFGIVDSLSKIENIKTVLIAATDQLEEGDKKTFDNYKEKAIDRTYTIDKYADEAPLKILGEEVWKVISIIAEEFEFNNLRTFEKTNLFIKEVIDILGEEVFTDKFTKADVYRMCFATIFFKIEHKEEKKLLKTKGSLSKFTKDFYDTEESGTIEYLFNFVLKNSFDNIMCKNVLHHILKWYETGVYSKELIMSLIESINSYDESPKNFYSSEQEILGIIDSFRNYIKNLNGTEPLDEIVTRLDTAFTWCEVLSVDFGICNEEIVKLIGRNISNKIDLTKNSYQNGIDSWSLLIENEETIRIVNSINEALNVEYFNLLLERIRKCFIEQNYNQLLYIKQLQDSIISTPDNLTRDIVVENITESQFFFPIPSGRITEEQWHWCHIINKLIKDIEVKWKIENYYNNFKSYINSLEVTKTDKLLQHRLNVLFGKD